jgi:enamine deaminase RidA (YjgF/YER057c/UK114 family)
VPEPAGAYVPATRSGTLNYTAGQLPFEGGELHKIGKVGDAVTPEEAGEAARLCALNALAAAAADAGGLNRIGRIVKVTSFIASAPDFNRQPEVVNGASELIGIGLWRGWAPRPLGRGCRGVAAGRSGRGRVNRRTERPMSRPSV